jgi:hypothetical protein
LKETIDADETTSIETVEDRGVIDEESSW